MVLLYVHYKVAAFNPVRPTRLDRSCEVYQEPGLFLLCEGFAHLVALFLSAAAALLLLKEVKRKRSMSHLGNARPQQATNLTKAAQATSHLLYIKTFVYNQHA